LTPISDFASENAIKIQSGTTIVDLVDFARD